MESKLENNLGDARDFTDATARSGGEIIQLPDGRAAVRASLKASDAGDKNAYYDKGRFRITKTASIVLLTGGKAFWDRSASSATYTQPSADDFYLGMVAEDAAADDPDVLIDLNERPTYRIELGKGRWSNEATLGLGVTATALGGTELTLSFDAVAEAAQAALLSVDKVALTQGPIFEAKIAIYNIGDDAALDINIGLANASHATDADAITESVFFHLDGNALDIKAESDDGTTEVVATDTTIDAVDDIYFEVWIDARVKSSVKLYINGVRVLSASTFVLTGAAGPLVPIIHLEKTSNDTVADVRVHEMTVRTSDATLSVAA